MDEITRLFNTFIDQRNIIINEINGISNRKRNFYSAFAQKKYYNFKYPNYLQNDLNEIRKRVEDSFINFETKLKEIRKKINDELKKLLNKQINLSNDIKKENNNNVNFEKDIMNIIDEQKKIEDDSIKEKDIKIENAFVESKKREINSEILNLKNSIEQISLININLVKILQSYQRLNNSINQKEKDSNNRHYFVSNEIENKTKNLDIIKNIRQKLEEKIILFRNKNNQVCNIINKYNSLEENINNKIRVCLENYKDNEEIECFVEMEREEENLSKKNNKNMFSVFFHSYDEKINYIREIKNEAEFELKNNNYDNNNEEYLISQLEQDINKIKLDIEFLYQDSFYKVKNDYDPAFTKLKEYEYNVLLELFNNCRKNVEKTILSRNNKLNNTPLISIEVIREIIANEDSFNFFKYKIIKEISLIANDDNQYIIENITILVIGRKGIGKTTLIKKVLDLNINIENKNQVNDDEFKIYTSNKIKYIKLIEVKGIRYDKNITPEMTKEKIKQYIDASINCNNQNYNNIVHCIWYCMSGTNFLEEEISLFNSLKAVYKDNIMPIIIVYVRAKDLKLTKRIENRMREDNIDNSFVNIMAEDMTLMNNKIIKAFGKEELIETTLSKCTEALGSNMMKIMLELISKNIKENLIRQNRVIMNNIINNTKKDFIINYKKVLKDDNFFLYIINIFFNHLNEFYDKKRMISNKSKNLIILSSFFTSFKNIYSDYKQIIKEMIEQEVEKKSEEFIDKQASMEKQYGNMKDTNRRSYDEFKKRTRIFLKENYYFIAQNYIIDFIVNESKYSIDFYSLFFDELCGIIRTLLDINNNDQNCILIRQYIEICYKKKLNSFSNNNIIMKPGTFMKKDLSSIPLQLIPPYIPDKNFVDDKIIPFERDDSLIFKKNKLNNFIHSIENIEIKKKF